MTNDSMNLNTRVEKLADADFLWEKIEVISNRLMRAIALGLAGTRQGNPQPS